MSEKEYKESECFYDNCKKTASYIVHEEFTISLCLEHFIQYKLEPGIKVECLNEIKLDPLRPPKQYKLDPEELCKLCPKKANYGTKGAKPEFCKLHRTEKCIKNPNTIHCSHLDCSNIAMYGNKKDKMPIFCTKHKTKDCKRIGEYIKCTYQDCYNKAKYNTKERRVPLFCMEHKSKGMENVYITYNKPEADSDKINEKIKSLLS